MRLSPVALAVALVLSPVVASAQMILKDSSDHERAPTIDATFSFGFFGYTHFGVGGHYAHPVMPNGFIPSLNDSFWVEGTVALDRYSWSYFGSCSTSWYRVTPMAGVRWAFHLTDAWTAFAKGKLGYGIGFGDSVDCGGVSYTGSGATYSQVAYDFGLGAYWHFSDAWQMRFDLGYWWSVGAGTQL